MKALPSRFLLGGLAAAISSIAMAGTQPFFNPLTQSTAVAPPGHINEINSPWQTPAGISQENLTSMEEIEADIDQSVVRVPGLSSSASMWDMTAFDPEAKYLFIPHETLVGAGVTRYDIENDFAEVLFSGDASGDWSELKDFGAFDPAIYTPFDTVLLGEEWSGEGRVIEVLNPYADPADIEIREKHSFVHVSQEGIGFGVVHTDTVYYVDEDHSGSIYKLVATDENFNQGQTFVLSVDGFDGDASARAYDNGVRVGTATWVPMTDVEGNPLTATDPFAGSGSSRPGRVAADELGATPYGRPEDVEVSTLANGNEVLYFAATGEAAVYSIEMTGGDSAVVREFASEANTPKNVGFPATTGVINAPDNLAQDAFGNIYIIEDAPNGGSVGGDIWFVRDADNDGEAESVDHFMSMQVSGAEATGMIFNPTKPTEYVVTVMHPGSTGIEGGWGDALWKFDITDVVPPTCEKGGRYNNISWADGHVVKTCSSDFDFNYVQKLNATEKHKHWHKKWKNKWHKKWDNKWDKWKKAKHHH